MQWTATETCPVWIHQQYLEVGDCCVVDICGCGSLITDASRNAIVRILTMLNITINEQVSTSRNWMLWTGTSWHDAWWSDKHEMTYSRRWISSISILNLLGSIDWRELQMQKFHLTDDEWLYSDEHWTATLTTLRPIRVDADYYLTLWKTLRFTHFVRQVCQWSTLPINTRMLTMRSTS